MAPLTSVKAERDKKTKNLLNFANSIPDCINRNASNPSLLADLQSQVQTLPMPAPTARLCELNSKGTELWNLSTRLNRSNEAPDKKVLYLLRVFSFGLIDSAHLGRSIRGASCVRLLKIAFKTAKFCLTSDALEHGVKVLERAASYLDELEKEDEHVIAEDEAMREKLKAEYFVLRTTLAWKQSKLDVAEYMFQKVTTSHITYNPASAEDLADALYEIGKDLFGQKRFDLAVRWLSRAHDVLSGLELEHLSDNAGELRLAIMQLLGKSLILSRTPDSLGEAKKILDLIDVDYSEKMVSSLLRLELLSSSPNPDAQEYHTTLLRMFRSVPLTKPNFKTIMHHVHKLKKLDQMTAAKALEDFLIVRLYDSEKEELIEKAAMMWLWILAQDPRPDMQSQFMRDALENISSNIQRPFSAAATHAAQTLLWKNIESAYSQKQYELAEAWCRLALHSLFERCGELNRGKIARKSMLCALARQDLTSAREIFFSMPESQQNAVQTRHLMYRLALHSGDTQTAAESLEIVCNNSGKDATLLYACVLEAQLAADKRQVLLALQKVLKKYDYNAPKGVHLPALLRCTTRLLKQEIGRRDSPSEDAMDDLCKIFEGAATQVQKPKRQGSLAQDFDKTEIEWFSRNSYNIALEFCSSAHPQHLDRLSRSCVQLSEALEKDAAPSEKQNLALRRVLCEFLSMSATIVLARSEDNREASLQHYLSVLEYSNTLRSLISSHIETSTLGEATRSDLISKHLEAVKYGLEAILRLSKWEDIDALFVAAFKFEDPRKWHTLADLAFLINKEIAQADSPVASTYQPKVFAFIQRIINRAWKSSGDIQELARWIRCLFQISLLTDEKISLHCIDQAISVARKCAESTTPFPTLELEWLAATSFNRAVDLYCASDFEDARGWAEKALMLAGCEEEGGGLERLLREKYAGLTWERD